MALFGGPLVHEDYAARAGYAAGAILAEPGKRCRGCAAG